MTGTNETQGARPQMSVLEDYVPTLDADDATKGAFRMDFQRPINQITRSDLLIIAGD